MAPRRPRDERLEELMAAAVKVFSSKGFHRARIEEIAQQAGVSPGNVYNYVTGKEALFALVMERSLDGTGRRASEPAFPLQGPSAEETIEWVAARLDFVSDFPVMEAALRRRTTQRPSEEVRAVIGELFDVLLRVRHAAAILERSAPDMPRLREVFLGVRRELFARMTRYIASRVETGAFLPLVEPAATARLLVEATSWATRGRLADPDPKTILPDAAVREALIELALRGLVASNRRGARRARPKEGRHARRTRTAR